MSKGNVQTLTHFRESLAELYANVDIWLNSTPLRTSREEIELREESSGPYKVEELIIKDVTGAIIARIMPVGAWVIGAKGRADLIGKLDKVIMVNLEKGGPVMTTTISCEGHEETSVTKFYKNIAETGWYWIEDRRRGKAHKIDKDTFYELLTEVSDYEFR
jgi:hypothetical protein